MKAFFLTLCLAASVASGAVAAETIAGRVSHVIDGDTFRLGDEKIRLWGHDTPERGDCGYKAATEALRAAVNGRSVTCWPIERDRYGRTVARCRAGGVDLSGYMVLAGWSHDFTRYSGGAYLAAEKAARSHRRGLWASCWAEGRP